MFRLVPGAQFDQRQFFGAFRKPDFFNVSLFAHGAAVYRAMSKVREPKSGDAGGIKGVSRCLIPEEYGDAEHEQEPRKAGFEKQPKGKQARSATG
jgi:hypothetical protein